MLNKQGSLRKVANRPTNAPCCAAAAVLRVQPEAYHLEHNKVPLSGFDIVAVQCTYSPIMAVFPTNLLLMPLAGAVTDLHTMVPNAHGLPAEAAPAALRVQTQANRHRQKAT